MSRPVFISYSRAASATHAQALAARLGDRAFLDTATIADADEFPQRLLDGILDASVVVIFATQAYLESRFCRLEMRLAITGGGQRSFAAIPGRWSSFPNISAPGLEIRQNLFWKYW